MEKNWRIHPHEPERISHLERTAGIPPIVAQLLLCRGVYDPSAVKAFLDCKLSGLRDPGELPGANEAARRVYAAVKDKRKIAVYGDYDADGMTAASLLVRCLRLLGADVSYYVPNRLEEGYGLNEEALRTLAKRGTSLVISVDCGIGSVHEAQVALEVGLELIVTDHHEVPDVLPAAAAIVHPRLPGTAYPFGGLCGAAVAFKLAWAICQEASQSKKVPDAMRDFLLSAVGIAAIGTVADVVPLLDENRIIVRHGLNSLRYSPPLGITELMKLTKLMDKPYLSSEDIAFTIGPRLNAAGRLGQAQLGIELLTTEDASRAKELAEYINVLNGSRDSLERSVYLAANKQIKEQFDPENDPALVLSGRGWHLGVIGIVAGRLAEKYHRPVILISLDQFNAKPGTGSGRTAAGVNLHAALGVCAEHLVGYGGHAAAAGVRITEDKIDAFREAFCDHVGSEFGDAGPTPEVRIDAEGPFSQLTSQIVQQIEMLAPFGAGNPRPVLCATGVKLAEPPRKMGSGDKHLSFKMIQHNVKLRGVGFGCAEWADELTSIDQPMDVAYRPVINDYQGRRSVELHLVDWRASK